MHHYRTNERIVHEKNNVYFKYECRDIRTDRSINMMNAHIIICLPIKIHAAIENMTHSTVGQPKKILKNFSTPAEKIS